jgi:hypothetical protein
VHRRTGGERIAYWSARSRCNNPSNKDYRYYGGRGIKFLFPSFKHFFAELGPKPTPDRELDRIENDGHYEPGNVRWATHSQQMKNKRYRSKEAKK